MKMFTLAKMIPQPKFSTQMLAFATLILMSISVALAQKSPGGVGNTNGTNGQPALALWLDASSLSLANGADVTTWSDLSGHNRHAVQNTTANKPIYVTNMVGGKAGIRFRPSAPNRTQTFLSYDGSHLINSPYSLFTVAARRSGGFQMIMAGSGGTSNSNLHWGWRDDSRFTLAQWSNDISLNLTSANLNTFSIFSSIRNNQSTPYGRAVFQNGFMLGTSDNNTTLLSSYDNPYIGRYQNSYYSIDVAEIIQYTSGLNEAQRIIVENYLALKYGTSIGSNQHYAHASYNQDLIGIGSSNGTIKHFASANSSAGLWLSESNASLDESNEYVFLAHSGIASGETTADLPLLAGGGALTARTARVWYLSRTMDKTTDVAMGFELSQIGLLPGIDNQVFYLLFRNAETGVFSIVPGAQGVLSEDMVWVTVSNSNLQNGYYTIARSNQTGRTWYSYKDGNWDDWRTWSLEQGGSDIVNPDFLTPTSSPTSIIDKVVINSNHRVSVTTNNKNNFHLQVELGIVDFGATTGHLFPTISGNAGGTIRLMADNFPEGNANLFNSETGGTVEYYGNGYQLLQNRSFNNLRINLANNGSSISLLADYSLAGNMTIERGSFSINDNLSTRILSLNIGKNLEVSANGRLVVGQGNTIGTYSIPGNMPPIGEYHSIFHQIRIGGNLTNEGIIRLTNQTAPHFGQFTNTGAATLTFFGASHNTASLNGTTDLYNLIIDKGNDQTFVLELYSDHVDFFRLFGPNNAGRRESTPFTAANPEIRKALWVKTGTLKLTGSVFIPSLSEGSQAGGNGDYAIPAKGALWIAGPDVKVYSTAHTSSTDFISGTSGIENGSSNQALSVLGKFKITQGFFSTRNSAGFIFWAASSAVVEINGGMVDAAQFRSAGSGGGEKTSFLMTGGELIVRSNLNNFIHNGQTLITQGGEPSSSFPIFGMVDSLGVFNMSGGIISIYRPSGNNVYNSNGIYINTKSVNHSVTGGTFRLIGYEENQTFDIFSTGNLYNLEITQTRTDRITRAYMGTDLHLEGDLFINNYTELHARRNHSGFNNRSYDLKVARSFNIQTNGKYEPFQNTTTLLATLSTTATFNTASPTFFNLTIERHPVLSSTHRTLSGSNILVLNNFSIGNACVVRHYNQNVTVRGDVSNSGTLSHVNAGNTGRLILTQRGILTRINVVNAGSYTSVPTITIAAPPAGGTQATAVPVFDGIPAAGNALPLRGILITNTGSGYTSVPTVTVSGAGTATAVISTSHQIGGNGEGRFAILDINEVHPTPTSTKVSRLTSNQKVTKSMILTNGILDLETFNLDVEGTLADNTINYYSNTRMFRTAGNHSDGGLTRTITANGTYLFPIGTSNYNNSAVRYAWANPTFSNITSPGKVQINGVPKRLPTLGTDNPESFLRYYWRVRNQGFTQLPNLTHSFFSYDADYDITGNFNQLRVGKVINNIRYPQATGDAIGTLIDVSPSRILSYDAFALETGEFTAARNNMFNGSVLIYYTRDHGASTGAAAREPRWRDRNTWTRSDLAGFDPTNPHKSSNPAIPAGDPKGIYPRTGDIAIIGWVPWDDPKVTLRGQPHGVWIDNTQEVTAKLQFTQMTDTDGKPVPRVVRSNFQFRPTVCINETNGQLTSGWVEGEGMFWIRFGDPNFALMDLGDFVKQDSAYIVYENNAANRTYNNVSAEVPNIVFANNDWGRNNHNVTLSKDITTNGNFEILGNLNLLMSTTATGDITVGRNLIMYETTDPLEGNTSGGGAEIAFRNSGTPRTLTVNGDVIMKNSSALIRVQSPNSTPALSHTLNVYGNIIQNSAGAASPNGFAFASDINNDHIVLNILGNQNKSWTYISGETPRLFKLNIDKGSSNLTRFTIHSAFTLEGPTNGTTKALSLMNGGLVLNNNSINITLSSGGADFVIPSTAGLIIDRGTARITSTGSNGILLDGLLEIKGPESANPGKLILNGGVGSDNYIEYSSSGNAQIRVVGGTLEVGSQIRGSLVNDAGILRYYQLAGGSGFGSGKVSVGINGAPQGSRGVLEVHNPKSLFQFYNGSLDIIKGHDNPAAASRAALYLNPEIKGLNEWGTINIGDGSNASLVTVNSTIELPSLRVKSHATAQTSTNHLHLFGHLNIDANANFDGNSLNLTLKKNLINLGNPSLKTDTLFLNASNEQYVNGNIIAQHLVVKPTTRSYILNSSNTFEVNGNMRIETGSFEDNGGRVFLRGNMENLGNHLSATGGKIVFDGSVTQRLTGTGQFGNLEIDNPAGVEINNDLSLEQNLTLTRGIFSIRNHLLNLGVNAQILGSDFSVTKMIATSGAFADKGIRRFVASSASQIDFPLGVVSGSQNKFTPAYVNITANSNSGYIRLYPVNQAHMTTIGPHVLQYYWSVETTELSGLDAELKLHYLNTDVRGNEANYIAARLEGDEWAKFPTNQVDEINDFILFTFSSAANMNGDYTAGIDPHIPAQIPVFISNGSGNWSDISKWTRQGGGEVPAGGPNGHIVRILEGDVISLDRFRVLAYRTELNGRLEAGTESGHNLGRVEGSGTLAVVEGKLPYGIYSSFLAAGTNSTIEYGGSGSYTIPDLTTLGLSSNSYNNLVVTGSGEKTLPAKHVHVRNDLSILNNASLRSVSPYYIYFYQNLYKDETAKLITGSYLYAFGSTSQEIHANLTGESSLHSFSIRNPAGMRINGNVDVTGSFYLDNGIITVAEGNRIYLRSLSGIHSWSLNNLHRSWVEGKMIRRLANGSNGNPSTTTNFFPIGKNGKPRFVTLNSVTQTSNQDWSIEYFDTNPNAAGMNTTSWDAQLKKVSEREYWRIDGPSPGSASIKLNWGEESMVDDTPAHLLTTTVAEWDGSKWINKGGSGTSSGTGTGHVTAGSPSSFSTKYFTIGSTSETNPLPVELLYFNAKLENNKVMLNWATASEINNAFFIVERSSDGRNFDGIALVAAQSENGYSNTLISYQIPDENPLQGISYYRLKQTDYDGQFEYSKIVAVQRSVQANFESLLYPNPNNGEYFNLVISGFTAQENIYLRIIDLYGKVISTQSFTADEEGKLLQSIQPQTHLPKGIYIIQLEAKSGSTAVRMVVK